MPKILIKFFLIFLFLTINSYSEIIKNLEVSGNQRISKETIFVLSDIKIGKILQTTPKHCFKKTL